MADNISTPASATPSFATNSQAPFATSSTSAAAPAWNAAALPAPTAAKQPSDSEESAAKRFRPDYSEVITVVVGKEGTKYIVHKASICAKSPFFAAACSKKWEEGQEGIVRLPTQRPKAFAMFLHWVYTGSIDMAMTDMNIETEPSYLTLAHLWVLGHYLQVLEFCNKLVDTMFARRRQLPRRHPNATTLKFACESIPSEGGARRFLFDLAVWCYGTETCEREEPQLPREIVTAIARKHIAGDLKTDSNPLKKTRCHYHDHNEGDAECK